MQYFGARYSAPVYGDLNGVRTPIGTPCAHCGEPVADGDSGFVIPSTEGPLPFHRVCHLRGVLGSVAHQQGRCSCYIEGASCGDDPALTRRQAAEAAVTYFFNHREQ